MSCIFKGGYKDTASTLYLLFVKMSLFRFAEPVNILENIRIVMYKKRNLQFKSLFNSVIYDRLYNTSIGKYYFYTNIIEKLFIPSTLIKKELIALGPRTQRVSSSLIIQIHWFSWYNSCSNRTGSRGIIAVPIA